MYIDRQINLLGVEVEMECDISTCFYRSSSCIGSQYLYQSIIQFKVQSKILDSKKTIAISQQCMIKTCRSRSKHRIPFQTPLQSKLILL